jgi:protein phosphatase
MLQNGGEQNLPEQTQRVGWQSAAVTHKGNVRSLNEDAYLAHSDDGVWAVADGMGGHHAGDVASQAVVDGLATVRGANDLGEISTACRTALAEVNEELFDKGLKQQAQIIGSTLVVMLTSGWDGTMLWAGDSRGYLLRQGKLFQITKDHSRTNELIDSGVLAPEAAESHPDANVITRAIGVAESVELEEQRFDICAGDVYLICSDGLTRYLSNEELERCLQIKSCREAADQLLRSTLATSARDNVTAIVMRAVEFDDSQTVLNSQTLSISDTDATLINPERTK